MEMAGVDLSHRGYQLACNASEVTLEAAIIASTAGLVYKGARAAITGFEWIQSLQAAKVSKSAVSTIEHAREFEVGGSVFYTEKFKPKEKSLNFLESYFSKLSYNQMERALVEKFGPPKGVGPYNKSFYNPKTGRTFNLHQDPKHRSGKPHVDIRKRGLPSDYYKNRPFFLKDEY